MAAGCPEASASAAGTGYSLRWSRPHVAAMAAGCPERMSWCCFGCLWLKMKAGRRSQQRLLNALSWEHGEGRTCTLVLTGLPLCGPIPALPLLPAAMLKAAQTMAQTLLSYCAKDIPTMQKIMCK